MTEADFFATLSSNEDFIFAVAHTNSFQKNDFGIYQYGLSFLPFWKINFVSPTNKSV